MVEIEEDELLFRYYLKEIIKVPLLTKEEEREIGKQINKKNKEALNKLINSNLRYVILRAKKYIGGGLSFLDLICEGNRGLIEAARRYDFRKGCRFLTYATFWIERYIQNSFFKEVDPRIPHNKFFKSMKIKKTSDKLYEDKGRSPNIDELAEKLNFSTKEIEDSLSIFKRTISLERKIEFEEIIKEQTYNPENVVEEKILKEDLYDALEKILSSKEVEIIKYRFGLSGKKLLTLEQVGDKLGCCKENVRRIQNIALKKLRASRKLKQYF